MLSNSRLVTNYINHQLIFKKKNSKLESELGLVSKLELGIGLRLEPDPKLELALKLKSYKFLFFIFSKFNLLFLWTRVRHVSFKEEKKFQVYNFFDNKFGGWERVGGDIMCVVDIGGHLALGYTYQIWFGTRPTKECFFLKKKIKEELRTESFEM